MKTTKIKISINNENEFYDRFNHDELSEELSDYIIRQSRKIGIKDKVIIEIITDFKMKEENKIEIDSLIKDYYKMRIRNYDIFSGVESSRDIILFLLGMLLIFISNMFSTKEFLIINQMFTIAAWVLTWQAISNIIFVNSNKKIQNIKFERLTKSEITFTDNKDL